MMGSRARLPAGRGRPTFCLRCTSMVSGGAQLCRGQAAGRCSHLVSSRPRPDCDGDSMRPFSRDAGLRIHTRYREKVDGKWLSGLRSLRWRATRRSSCVGKEGLVCGQVVGGGGRCTREVLGRFWTKGPKCSGSVLRPAAGRCRRALDFEMSGARQGRGQGPSLQQILEGYWPPTVGGGGPVARARSGPPARLARCGLPTWWGSWPGRDQEYVCTFEASTT